MNGRTLWLAAAAVLLVLLAIAETALLSRRIPDAVNARIDRLLAENELHPVGRRSVSWLELDAASIPTGLYVEASERSGFDLSKYRGHRVRLVSVPLLERSQSREGAMSAYFAYVGDKIVGAYVGMAGYVPGVVALGERSAYLPEGVTSNAIMNTRIFTIDVAGPWVEDRWLRSATITDHSAIDHIARMIEASKPARGKLPVDNGAEEYALTLNYEDGPSLTLRLTANPSEPDVLTFDAWPLSKTTLTPSETLGTYCADVLNRR